MAQLFILFEHATGYTLFKVNDFEESSNFVLQLQKCVAKISKFQKLVELVSFQPFTTGRDALENMNSVSEGILHEQLQLFLENNLPKSKKKHPITLGVGDSKLGAVISEVLGISCSVSGAVPEIIRGIRVHYHNLVPAIKDLNSANKAQLGLGHHYSRARVKFNVNKIDNMIIQSINLVDQLDKDINTFSMRVREWYSFHFPELIKIVPENHLYIRCVSAIQDRKNMPDDIEEQLESILMDSAKVQSILEVARSSMGMEISPLDMENVTVFAKRIHSLMIRRKELFEYLKSKMHNVAPNLAILIGDLVGARLIAHAGSLINLAKFPASTVQILGAEKALFRALKTHGNTPKYGLIYHSTFIGRAGKINKGRISRYLANKCAVASRIDCFRDIPTDVFGTKLRQQVEDRLKFYETGELPDKNIDVMTVALSEAEVAAAGIAKAKRKADKKEKKRKSQQLDDMTQNSFIASENGDLLDESALNTSKSNKRKRDDSEENGPEETVPDYLNMDESQVDDPILLKKIKKAKKREKKRLMALQESMNTTGDTSAFTNDSVLTNDSLNVSNDQSVEKKAKKREKKRLMALQESMNTTGNTSAFSNDSLNVSNDQALGDPMIKKKKKKKKSHERVDG